MLEKISLYLTMAVVVLAPLPFGSIETVWIIPWCFLLGIALPLANLHKIRQAHLILLAPVLAVALLFAAIVWLQTRSPPWIGTPNPIWGEAGKIMGFALPPRISASVPAPWMSLGVPLSMLLAFLCGFVTSIDPRNARKLVRAVAISGAVFAAYGILSFLIDPTVLLWRRKASYLGNLTATFVNRNTTATYFGTCAILWLALGWSSAMEIFSGVPFRSAFAALTQRPPRRLVAAAAGFFVCLIALLLTLSRAGTLLSLSAMVITAGLLGHRHLSGARKPLWAIGLAGVAMALLIELLGSGIAYRVGSEGLVDIGRLEAYRSTLSLIRHFPLLGTGLGTFPAVFQAYRSAATGTSGIWNHAHNTPLEFAAELGVPLVIALSAVCVFIIFRLIRGGIIRRRHGMFPASAAGICFLGLAHSTVDFSLLIPGYAIVFAALVGCGLAQSVPSGEPQRTAAPARAERAAAAAAPAQPGLAT